MTAKLDLWNPVLFAGACIAGAARLKMKRRGMSFLLTIALAICVFNVREGQANPIPITGGQPKLVIFLVADQFPYNQFWGCVNQAQTSGFKHLLENGANFTACRYAGATNQSSANLAVIAAGAYPWCNGIIANEWYDRHKQKLVKAGLEDDKAAVDDVPNKSIAGTILGDELKIATGGLSHVVAISAAEQDASLLRGKLGDEGLWWDTKSGNFAEVNRSAKDISAWAKKFNQLHYSEKYLGKIWQPVSTSSSNYDAYAKAVSTSDKAFAHYINDNSMTAGEAYYSQFAATPWANQMLIDFAREAIDQEGLGQHDTTDMLSISFPAFEVVGKNYGTASQESRDLALRFDQSLSEFLQYLDRKVGLNNCLVIFTACRGAAPSPDLMRAQGVEAGLIDGKAFVKQVNSALAGRLGGTNWIESFAPPNLYLNLNAVDHSSYRQPDIEKMAAKFGRSFTGVAEIYTAFQLFANQLPAGAQADSVRKSYYWGRSGELYVIPKPGYVFTADSGGIVGGSPYSYDVQVPLIISGAQIKPGTYASAVSPADIAPTVANILGICSPSVAEGNVLSEALDTGAKNKPARIR